MIVQLFILYNWNYAMSTTNFDKNEKNMKVVRDVDLKIIKIYLNKRCKNLQKF